VPAHYDEAAGRYAIDFPFPSQYDPAAKRWLHEEPLTWEQVFERWKRRGPMNERYVEMIQGRFGGRGVN
jgi:ring-1,2-phenylacetyl-CoA epoxidase subunit PaaA